MSDLSLADVERALAIGRGIDLSDCVYGPVHWASDEFVDHVPAYYSLLAGLVRATGATRVAELGTHYGGSTQALLRGLPDDPAARVVTVDVTHLNEDALAQYPKLVRCTGDSLAPDVVARFVGAFDRHADLLYVDTVHTYRQTLENLAVYANRLKPRVVVLDDIRLNDQMRALWRTLEEAGAGALWDVSELVQREDAGFGVLACRYPHTWPEAAPPMRRALRAVWSVERRVGGALPERVKGPLRKLVHALPRRLS